MKPKPLRQLQSMSIRTMLITLVCTALLGLVITGSKGIMAMLALDADERRLLSVSLPVLKQNMAVYDAVSDTARLVLSYRSGETQANNAQQHLSVVHNLDPQYQHLDQLLANEVEALGALTVVKQTHREFLEQDRQLQSIHAQERELRYLLDDFSKQINDQLAKIDVYAGSIERGVRAAGRAEKNLSHQNIRALRDALRQGAVVRDADLAKLQNAQAKNTEDTIVLASRIKFGGMRLMLLTRELMAVEDLEQLQDLRDGRIAKLSKFLMFTLSRIKNSLAHDSRLSKTAEELEKNLKKMSDLILAEENSAFSLRQRWLKLDLAAVASAKASDQSMKALVQALQQLSDVVYREIEGSVLHADQIIQSSRAQLILLSLLGGCVVLMVGFGVHRATRQIMTRVQSVARRIAEGDLSEKIDPLGGRECAQLMQSLSDMQHCLKVQQQRNMQLLSQTKTAQQALECASANVLMLDKSGRVLYANRAFKQLLSESDPKGALRQLEGQSLEHFCTQKLFSEHGDIRRALVECQSLEKTEARFGYSVYHVSVQPVITAQGEVIGSVLDWEEKTHEIGMQQAVQRVVNRAQVGDLDGRLPVSEFSGFLKDISQDINAFLAGNQHMVSDLGHTLSRYAQGDLRRGLEGDYHGIYAQLQADCNEMARQFSVALASIKHTVDVVQVGAGEISRENEKLSKRTELQAANLQESATSISQLASSVMHNRESVNNASQYAVDAREKSLEGEKANQLATQAMDELDQCSTRISEITDVINRVSFQTHMLALNAAVEAASAGDHGKGFAVVAREVGELAKRCAEAAKQIQQNVDDSEQKVAHGVRSVKLSAEVMDSLLQAVHQTSEVMNQVAIAQEQQAASIQAVDTALEDLSQATQSNAYLVEHVAVASREMANGAQELAQQVNYFKTA